MHYIITQDNLYENEIMELVRVFLPDYEIKTVDTPQLVQSTDLLLKCRFRVESNKLTASAVLFLGVDCICEKVLVEEFIEYGNELELKRHIKNLLKRCVYELYSGYTGKTQKWGILTGIRPTKIVHALLDADKNNDEIKDILISNYRMAKDKVQLLEDIVKVQRDIIADNNEMKISLYIHIPVCTSKCLYCSFPSDIIKSCHAYLDDYLNALIRELSIVTDKLFMHGHYIDSIYIGGGTPTSLSVSQLNELLSRIEDLVTGQPLKEYTVEAGRPDSIDEDKLFLLKKHGITRISINPQTMNNQTLARIGRNHTIEQFLECYHRAREIGFDVINTDMIVGLPGEASDDVLNTTEELIRLAPENITVHTLSIKRSSSLKQRVWEMDLMSKDDTIQLLKQCEDKIKSAGYIPYYMYRQKYMLGNLENVGYCKQGKECIYNIQMMEEKQSIWAFGAGAVSKIYHKREDIIKRIPNVKNLNEYIGRIEEMIDKKLKVLKSY